MQLEAHCMLPSHILLYSGALGFRLLLTFPVSKRSNPFSSGCHEEIFGCVLARWRFESTTTCTKAEGFLPLDHGASRSLIPPTSSP